MVISIRRRPSRFTGSLEGGGSSGGGRTKTSMAPPASKEDAAYHFKGTASVTGMDSGLNKLTNEGPTGENKELLLIRPFVPLARRRLSLVLSSPLF